MWCLSDERTRTCIHNNNIVIVKKVFLFIVVKYDNNQVLSFVSRCGHLWFRSRRFDCILLVFIRRWVRLVTRHLLSRMLRCDWLVFQQLWLVGFSAAVIGAFRSSLFCGYEAQFVSTISSETILDNEIMVCFEVELFTNVPTDASVQAALQKLEDDTSLADRTTLTPAQIADLLHFVLRSTYFQYNGSIYEQKLLEGADMGSPVSAVIANL